MNEYSRGVQDLATWIKNEFEKCRNWSDFLKLRSEFKAIYKNLEKGMAEDFFREKLRRTVRAT